MESEETKIKNSPNKSHEALLKVLNNIGIIGAIFAGVADLILVIIFVVGINIQTKGTSSMIFAVINAIIGILINVLLRYQGQKYAEIENEELCKSFYKKKAKERKKTMSMEVWQILQVLKDIVFKGATTAFSIFGLIYISIEGSKDTVQILITIVTLVLFTCFGLLNMNTAYNRFYNIQIPYMELKIKEEIKKNGDL